MRRTVLDDGEVLTAADHAAGIFEGTGNSTYIGMTKVISVRLPLLQFVNLQALAHKSGKTRNSTIVTLLDVGLEEVESRLSPETLSQVEVLKAELFDEAGEVGVAQ